MKKCSERLGAAPSALALMLLASTAHAQGAPPGANKISKNGIEEVVVTAQRRSESLQKTSVVVSVISATTLTRNSVTQPQALTSVLPGVQIGIAGAALQIYVRGVGDYGSTANTNPAVAFNIDGIYVGRSQSISSEFYDISRVEVLKGPQGTLYGRNASGGAINVLTVRPKLGTYSGQILTELSNFNGRSVSGGLNIPISPTVAARISGTFVDKDGFTSEGYGDDKHESARLKLLWQANSDVSLLFNGSYGHVGGKGTDYVLITKDPAYKGQYPWTDATDPAVKSFENAGLASTLPPIPGIVEDAGPNDGFQNLNFFNLSTQLDADLGFAKLTLVPAYRDASLTYSDPNLVLYQVGKGFGDLPAQPETSHQTSVELRLANDYTWLKWVVGGYFYNENQYSQYLTYNGLLANSGTNYTYDTRSYSGFGQATYSVTPAIRLIGGLRYTDDERQIDGTKVNVAPTLSCPLTPGAICPVESYAGSASFSNISFKGGIEADLTPRSLFFFTVSTGFKAGGFNTEIAPNAAPGSTGADEFQPEKLTTYEIGIKNRFLNDRLQVNLEGFYYDYVNHQEPVIEISGSGNPGLNTINAGKATIFGGSIDIVAKPWPAGTFNFNTEYDNTKYDQFTTYEPAAFVFPGSSGCKVGPSNKPVGLYGPILAIDCSGFEVTHAPKFAGTLGYTHVIPIGTLGDELDARADLQYASARWLSADFISEARAPAYVTLNAMLTFVSHQRWTLTGFVRNISNAVVYTGGIEGPFQPGIYAGNVQPPRTYGGQLGYQF